MSGHLIAFEGLDQSGKQTQAERLRDRLKGGRAESAARVVSDYGTSIGEEIARALSNERDYGPDVMQLLYVANRYEKKSDLQVGFVPVSTCLRPASAQSRPAAAGSREKGCAGALEGLEAC